MTDSVAAWILIGILSFTLLVLLTLLIILTIKALRISKEINKIILTGQGIADKADDIVTHVRSVTSITGVAKNLLQRYNLNKPEHHSRRSKYHKKGKTHGQ